MFNTLADLRNIGISAHIDAGKTTTTERMLYYTKKIHKVGEVHEGTATMDWMPQEQERGITITAAATTCHWKNKRINIIDTPGHVDFTVEVERSMRVLDGVVIVLCGVGGVEPQTETVWRQADKNHVPRLVYVNKLDRTGASFENVLKNLREKMGPASFAIQYPVGEEAQFSGIIDLVAWKASIYGESLDDLIEEKEIPEELQQQALPYRNQLIEFLSDHDDAIMTAYLENRPVDSKDMKRVIRKLTVEGKLYPVLCGSSFKNKGVRLLLDAVVDYLPSPQDKADLAGTNEKGDKKILLKQVRESPFSALAFKITHDSYIGRMTFVRVYSGQIKKGERIFNAANGKKEKIGRLLLMHANHQEDVETLEAGEIGVLVGLKYTRTGDSLCREGFPILLEKIKFPEPVISMSVEPKNQSDSLKLDEVINRFLDEDPTFKVSINQETGQKLISGMGELHLEIIKDRILREYNLDIRVGNPQVAYHETIMQSSVADITVDRVIGGKRIFAHLTLKMEPLRRGTGVQVEIDCKEAEIPFLFHEAIRATLISATSCGFSGIYPVVDIKMTVTGGAMQEEDSTESAFQIAASQAFEKSLGQARPVLLEPIMKLEVVTPEEYNGDVVGDLNSRRGKILEMNSKASMRIIDAEVPLATIFGYATVIRSLSRGRASYSMEPFRFEVVPKQVEEKILSWMKK